MNRLLYSLILLLSLFEYNYAQREAVLQQPYVDLRRYYLGFRVGTHLQRMNIINTGLEEKDGNRLLASSPIYGQGVSVGLVGGYVIIPNLELRFIPTLHFGEQQISYSYQREEKEQIRLRSNSLQFPLQLKYTAIRLNNIRPFVGIGAYTSLALGQQKGAILRTNSWAYGLTLSLGCDFYLQKVKICPELSFSYGLSDVLLRNRSDLINKEEIKYTQAIHKAIPRMLLFTLNFE